MKWNLPKGENSDQGEDHSSIKELLESPEVATNPDVFLQSGNISCCHFPQQSVLEYQPSQIKEDKGQPDAKNNILL